jgi:molybdopterin-guanine dinucleotide biosynthesis protein A
VRIATGRDRGGTRLSQAIAGATGIVLAGGGSRRFGSDKLAVAVEGIPLLHHPILRLAEVCREVIVVLAPGAEEPSTPLAAPVRLVRDASEGQGPLIGVLAGLSDVGTEWALVAGGDMPTLQTSVLLEMLTVAGQAGVDAVVLQDGDRFRPLPLVLRSRPAREAAHALVHTGERRLRALADALRTAVIDEPTWLALDPRRATLRDIDEPGDLAR